MVSKRVNIRRLHQFELPRAARLMLSVYDASGFSPDEREAFAHGLSHQVLGTLFRTGVLSGYGAFLGMRLIGAVIIREKRHLSQLFVLPDFQRQGIGRKLVLHAFPNPQDGPFTVCATHTSVLFYRSLGFQPAPDAGRNGRQDTIWMQADALINTRFVQKVN